MKIRYIMIASVVLFSIAMVVRAMILNAANLDSLPGHESDLEAIHAHSNSGETIRYPLVSEGPYTGLDMAIAENTAGQLSVYRNLVVSSFPAIRDVISMKSNQGYEMLYKGLEVDITVESDHAFVRPGQSTEGSIASALLKLEQQLMPERYEAGITLLFKYLTPHLGFAKKVFFSDDGLFEPMFKSVLEQSLFTEATIRKSFAPTVEGNGMKGNNALPAEAIAYMRGAVDGPRVVVKKAEYAEDGFSISAGKLF